MPTPEELQLLLSSNPSIQGESNIRPDLNFIESLSNLINDYKISTDPDIVAPAYSNPNYNVGKFLTPDNTIVDDYSQVNVGGEITNGWWSNAYNSFRKGYLETQLSNIRGKLEVSAPLLEGFGFNVYDGPSAIIDSYPDDIKDLDNRFANGELNEVDYNLQKNKLDQVYSDAQKQYNELKSEESKIESTLNSGNYPISKNYLMSQANVQAKGDQASIIDKFLYSAPNTLGSSASLLLPQLAATFGSQLTKNLIRSSAAYALGPEAGIPANIIGSVGAIATSLVELTYGRQQESYAEVGGTIQAAREKLMQEEYPKMLENYLLSSQGLYKSIEEIPDSVKEEFQRQIRKQSRQGAEMQFKENMTLVAQDLSSALLMPLGTLSKTIGSLGRLSVAGEEIASTYNAIKNYNLLSRGGFILGKRYVDAIGEKFEEGFQYAADRRAEDTIFGKGEYLNKGFIANVLQDGYDTAGSLNYSMIPGIDVRGNGKYSEDKEFQFSENSGGLLSVIMGSIPMSFQIGKELQLYRQAKKDLINNGVEDVDGKYKRLQSSIYNKYFQNGRIGNLLEAVRNITGKLDENGNEIISPQESNELIQDIKTAYNNYTQASGNVENILNNGQNRFENKKEFIIAKKKLLEDLVSLSNNLVTRNKIAPELEVSRDNILLSTSGNIDYNGQQLINYQSQLQAIDEMIKAHDEVDPNIDNVSNDIINNHISYLQTKRSDLENLIRDIQNKLNESGFDINSLPQELDIDLIAANKEIFQNELFNLDNELEYNKISKIKTASQLKQYFLNNLNRPIGDAELVTDQQEANSNESITNEDDSLNNLYDESNEEVPPIDLIPTGEVVTLDTDEDIVLNEEVIGNVVETIDNTARIKELQDKADALIEKGVTDFRPRHNELLSQGLSREEVLRTTEKEWYNTPEGKQYLNLLDQIDQLSKPSDNSISYNNIEAILSNSELNTPAKKAAQLSKLLENNNVDINNIQDVLDSLKSIIDNENYSQISNLLSLIVPNYNEYDIDEELNAQPKSVNIPPIQSNTEEISRQNEQISNDIRANSNEGTGFKVTSGMSLASSHINYSRVGSSYYNNRDNSGNLSYNTNNVTQQLVNTGIINEGDILNIRVPNVPDSKKESSGLVDPYVGVDIQIYKTVTLDTGLTKDVYIGSLHEVNWLDNGLAKTGDSELDAQTLLEEKSKLLTNRKFIIDNIIDNPSTTFELNITSKKFGFLNTSKVSGTIKSVIGTDTRPTLTYVGNDGFPITINNKPIISQGNMRPGAVILIVPNNIANKTIYIPTYVIKKQILNNSKIQQELYDNIYTWLGDKSSIRILNTKIDKYLFTTSNNTLITALGKSGIFIGINKATKDKYVVVNGNKYSINDLSNNNDVTNQDLLNDIGQIYVNFNKNYLQNNAYIQHMMINGLLHTNVQANPVLLNNNQLADIIDENNRYSYFSQHTVELSDPVIISQSQDLNVNETSDIPSTNEIIVIANGEERLVNLEDIVSPSGDETLSYIKESNGDLTLISSFVDPIIGQPSIQDSESIILDANSRLSEQEFNDILSYNGLDFELDLFQDNTDNISDNNTGIRKELLVSSEIPLSLQNEIVDSLAYQLLNNSRDNISINNSNINTVRKFISDKKALVDKLLPIAPANKIQALTDASINYDLILTNFQALIKKSQDLVRGLGFNLVEDSDYYETLEENTDEVTQFDDNANSTRNHKEFLPGEVKKLIYFIPAIQTLDPSIEEDNKIIQSTGNTYKVQSNSLGLPYFNNFNDTWEKVLDVTSSIYIPSNISGFEKLIQVLKNPNNYPVVQEVGKILETAPKQVQNAFVRRTNLQKQDNITMLYSEESTSNVDYVREIAAKTGFLGVISRGVKRFARIFSADRNSGIRKIRKELEAEFVNSGTDIIQKVQDEFGREVYSVNTEYAQNLKERLSNLLDQDSSYVTRTIGTTIKRVNLTNDAKIDIYNILKAAGLDIQYSTFLDLLRSYITDNGNKGEIATIKELFVQRYLGRLSGNFSNREKVSDDEDVENETPNSYKKNNPFYKETKSIDAIVRREYKYRKSNNTGSFRHDGKSYYAFTRHSYLSEFFTKILEYKNTGVDNFIKGKLSVDNFAKRSVLLNGLLNGENVGLDLSYELGAKNTQGFSDSKLLIDMTPTEHEVTKLIYFQNQGRNLSRMMFDTLSDKTTKPIVTMKRFIPQYSVTATGDIQLKKESYDLLYTYFQAEFDRITKTIADNKDKNFPNENRIKGYHDIGSNNGMGKYFNIYYFLNKAVLDAGSANDVKLSIDLYNSDGSFKYESTEDIPNDLQQRIKSKIVKNYIDDTIKTIEDWKRLGLFNITNRVKNKFKPEVSNIFDHNYLWNKPNSNKSSLSVMDILGFTEQNSDRINNGKFNGDYSGYTQDELEQIITYIALDYNFNYTIFSNEMLMITGDIAQAGKLASKDQIQSITNKYKDNPLQLEKYKLLAHIDATKVNLSKRNAAFLGSGEKGANFENEFYNVSIAKDLPIDSNHFEQYKKLFPDNISGITKAYKSGDKTDAQEFTTVKEHLDIMFAYGAIDEVTRNKALYIYDKADYNKHINQPISISQTDRERIYKLVMQPAKPVQRTYNLDNNLQISKQYYIKTSSYPLIPELVDGAMLDLLNDMKSNNIQRVVFETGVKQGIAGSKSIINNDGSYNKGFFENNINTLNRDGFRIQLEVPYKEYKDHIREGTQQSKLLFVDIPDNIVLNYNGSNVTAGELKKLYVDYHKNILDSLRKELFKELNIKNIGGNLVMNNAKLSQILQQEGMGRGYSLNSLLGLDLDVNGNFKVPLTFLTNAGQIEPVITSILSNRLARLDMPGKSYIQGSEFMLMSGKVRVESDENLQDRRDIIWTKPEYSGLEKLNYLTKDNEGNVIPAQIIMPFYFIKDEQVINIDEYTIVDEQGRKLIDTSKIDPELLQQNGFRIPFQGHNSGMWFEIVGFLPKVVGDLIIVPAEIAGQMGSDYDVDKLYSYMYNYYTDPTGNIKKVDENTNSIEGIGENELNIKKNQNKLIDIQKSIYTASDENIFRSILNPLSFDDVQDAVNYASSDVEQDFQPVYSTIYQRGVYFSNLAGKLGTAISANANTSHAIAQIANVYIKGQGVVFLDENNRSYSDFIPNISNTIGEDSIINSVTSINKDTYIDTEGDNQNVPENNSAWRLDKVYTFDGKYKISDLISQILGVSVDNAKEQLLGKFGINEQNFNVSLLLVRSGLNLVQTRMFINQPILLEYYRNLGDATNIYNVNYTSNKQQKIVEDLFRKYREVGGISEDIYTRNGINGYNLSDLTDSFNKGVVDEENALQQLEILKAYLHYQDIARSLQAVNTAFNIDTKALPKNMSDTVAKDQDITNVNNNVLIGNIDKIRSTSIPGLFTNIPNLAIDLFMNNINPLFAYASNAYSNIKELIPQLIGRESLISSQIDNIHSKIKEFIYSGFEVNLPIAEERMRLLFDTSNNKSLQTRLLELKAKYPKNLFLESIEPVISQYADTAKLIEIPMTNEQDFIQKISEQWQYMLYDDNLELRNFAEDLVLYGLYVSPQEYGTSNIIKYIPFDYLDNIGFSNYLQNINNNLSDPEFLNNFINQYIRHSPDILPVAKEEYFLDNSANYNVITTDTGKEIKGVLNSFTLPDINLVRSENSAASLIRNVSNTIGYPSYLSFYNRGIGKSIYFGTVNSDNSVTYNRVSSLGDQNMSEYNFANADSNYPSVNNSNNSLDSNEPVVSLILTSNQQVIESSDEYTPIKDNQEYLTQDNNADQILEGIIQESSSIIGDSDSTGSNTVYAKLYNFLANRLQFTGLNNTKIVINNTPTGASASYNASNNTVTFTPNTIYRNNRTGLSNILEKERIILHELIHAKVSDILNNGTESQKAKFNKINEVWEAYRANVRNSKEDTIRGISVNVFDAEMFSLINGLWRKQFTSDEFNRVNFREFVKGYLTNDLDNSRKNELLNSLSDRLTKLYEQGKIPKANYDLISSRDRVEDFKKYIGEKYLGKGLNDLVNKYYPYYNVQEFITESLTNKETQSILKQLPSIWKDFISKLKDVLADIFGIQSNDRTLFNDAIDSIFDFTELNLNDTNNRLNQEDSIERPNEGINFDLDTSNNLEKNIVRNKYTDEIEKVLAPNGNDSILYKDINKLISNKEKALKYYNKIFTPAFKNWFGDWENDPNNSSKAVDANGEPKLFYHATPEVFSEFSKEKLGSTTQTKLSQVGFFFTEDKNAYRHLSKSFMTVFLNYRNPMELSDTMVKSNQQMKGVSEEKFLNEINNIEDSSIDAFILNFNRQYGDKVETYIKEIVIKESNQIKSPLSNDFSINSGDIYFEPDISNIISISDINNLPCA